MVTKFRIFTGHIYKILFYILSLTVTVVITAWVTTKVNKILEKAGEPKITAKIESISLYQNLSLNSCAGEIVLNITNLENKPTYLKIGTILLNISATGKNSFSLFIDRTLPLNGFEIKSDSIRFDLPDMNLLLNDSLRCPDLTCTINVYYPNKRIAKVALFDTTTEKIYFIFKWAPPPNIAFNDLRNLYNKHRLPKAWKKVEIQYFGSIYDCYYYSEDNSVLKIIYSDEGLDYEYGDDPYYPTICDSGRITDSFVFIPHPEIKNRFIDFDKRDLCISMQSQSKGVTDIVNKKISVRRGYLQVYNIRQ